MKEDEPLLALKLTPRFIHQCTWLPTVSRSRHRLTNLCNLRLAFKVRTPKRSGVTVDPTIGFLEPSQAIAFEIRRKPCDHRQDTDKMSVSFVDVTDDAKVAEELFGSKRREGTIGFVDRLNVDLSVKTKKSKW